MSKHPEVDENYRESILTIFKYVSQALRIVTTFFIRLHNYWWFFDFDYNINRHADRSLWYMYIYIFLVRCGTLKEFSPPQGFSLKLNWTGTNDFKTRSTRRCPQVAAFFFFLFLNFFLNLRTMWKKKSSISKIKKYACRPGVPQRFLVWPTDWLSAPRVSCQIVRQRMTKTKFHSNEQRNAHEAPFGSARVAAAAAAVVASCSSPCSWEASG